MTTTTEAEWTRKHAHELTPQPRIPEPLTDQERELLHLAVSPNFVRGQRETAIVSAGYRVTTFWQLVNELINDVRALHAEPVIVNRLRRLRERRYFKGGTPS